METEDINKLYEWVNSRYEQYAQGIITEEEYLKDLDYYKKKLAQSEQDIQQYVTEEEEVSNQEKINPNKVRSTSIAGLRAKLLEEMKD
ncbi:MAG: hypothetical protein INQ03_05915 [Candidatus Heimdallarchaeota archaeon]|nr:hypothetical protein [Candidatus Heimdallarchaeota archaeon]